MFTEIVLTSLNAALPHRSHIDICIFHFFHWLPQFPFRPCPVHNGIILRRMGEFEPARLSAKDMEYTTIQQVLQKLEKRFAPIEIT
ncbi:MAG: fructose 1,6-bisphosphatase [Candidatus Bathyarchaeia archaeon]